eukprot:scaffold22127_cov90-Isochrysis_galbana.AAC.1
MEASEYRESESVSERSGRGSMETWRRGLLAMGPDARLMPLLCSSSLGRFALSLSGGWEALYAPQ